MTSSRARSRAADVLAACFLLASMMPGVAAAADSAYSLDLSAYRGKVVVVDFWASWCVPCRRSFPWLDAMQRKYAAEGLVVIGVNEDKASGDAAAFLKAVPVSFKTVPDRDGEIALAFGLLAMPSTYVFGRDGEIAARHLGFRTAQQDEYEAVLRELLDRQLPASGTED